MEQIYQFLLLFAKELVILPLFLMGYFFYNRNLFFQAIVLLLWSMIIAAFLKFLFKIPLLPHLGEGWSFPSGHMFAACSFLGFLAWEIRNKFIRLAVVALLIGIGYSLVQCHYHIWMDVLAAAFFALLFIVFYRTLLISTSLGNNNALLSFTALIVSLVLIYFVSPFKSIFYLPLGTLAGLASGSFIRQSSSFTKSISLKVEIPLCLTGLLLIYLSAPFLSNPLISPLFLLYFFIGFWIMVGSNLFLYFTRH